MTIFGCFFCGAADSPLRLRSRCETGQKPELTPSIAPRLLPYQKKISSIYCQLMTSCASSYRVKSIKSSTSNSTEFRADL